MENLIQSASAWQVLNILGLIGMSLQVLYILLKAKKNKKRLTWKHWTLVFVWCTFVVVYELIIDPKLEPHIINFIKTNPEVTETIHELSIITGF